MLVFTYNNYHSLPSSQNSNQWMKIWQVYLLSHIIFPLSKGVYFFYFGLFPILSVWQLPTS